METTENKTRSSNENNRESTTEREVSTVQTSTTFQSSLSNVKEITSTEALSSQSPDSVKRTRSHPLRHTKTEQNVNAIHIDSSSSLSSSSSLPSVISRSSSPDSTPTGSPQKNSPLQTRPTKHKPKSSSSTSSNLLKQQQQQQQQQTDTNLQSDDEKDFVPSTRKDPVSLHKSKDESSSKIFEKKESKDLMTHFKNGVHVRILF